MVSALEQQYWNWFNSKLKVPPDTRVPLVTAYIALFRNDRKQAIRVINKLGGTHYTTKRLREWERKATRVAAPAERFMRVMVIKAKFGEAGDDLCRLLNLEINNGDLL